MQHVNNLVDLTTMTRAGSQAPRDKTTAELVNQIFKRLVVQCTAWKQAVEGDKDKYQAEYKRLLLEALVRERVTKWEQVLKGLAAHTSPFLPNPNQFAKDCIAVDKETTALDLQARKPFNESIALPDITGKEKRREAGKKAMELAKIQMATGH